MSTPQTQEIPYTNNLSLHSHSNSHSVTYSFTLTLTHPVSHVHPHMCSAAVVLSPSHINTNTDTHMPWQKSDPYKPCPTHPSPSTHFISSSALLDNESPENVTQTFTTLSHQNNLGLCYHVWNQQVQQDDLDICATCCHSMVQLPDPSD